MKKMTIVLAAAIGVSTLFAEGVFKAGFSRQDVTPPLGTPLAGYYHYRPMTGILDPLEAICIALSDGEGTALVFTVDHLQFSNDFIERARIRISEETGVAKDAIYIAATHTHLGPLNDVNKVMKRQSPEEIERGKGFIDIANTIILSGLVDAGKYAIADMVDSKLAMARGEAKGLSFIRRFRMKDGTVRTNPGVLNPKIDSALGESDATLPLVRFMREGRPDIALINFQTHPDVIGGSKCSADWPGFARRTFEKLFDGEVHAVLFNGTQGDTNHINVNPPDELKRIHRYELARHMGRKIAGVALGLWDVAKEIEPGKIGWKVQRVKVSARAIDPDKVPYYRNVAKLYYANRLEEIKLETGVGMELTSTIAEALSCLNVVDNGISEFDMPMSCVTVGKSLAFCGFPGEPFTDLGRKVKFGSKFNVTVTTCCTGGSFGYLPTAIAFEQGGYERRSSRFAQGVGESLAAGGLAALDELYGKAK
jgi:hypothetical protein